MTTFLSTMSMIADTLEMEAVHTADNPECDENGEQYTCQFTIALDQKSILARKIAQQDIGNAAIISLLATATNETIIVGPSQAEVSSAIDIDILHYKIEETWADILRDILDTIKTWSYDANKKAFTSAEFGSDQEQSYAAQSIKLLTGISCGDILTTGKNGKKISLTPKESYLDDTGNFITNTLGTQIAKEQLPQHPDFN